MFVGGRRGRNEKLARGEFRGKTGVPSNLPLDIHFFQTDHGLLEGYVLDIMRAMGDTAINILNNSLLRKRR